MLTKTVSICGTFNTNTYGLVTYCTTLGSALKSLCEFVRPSLRYQLANMFTWYHILHSYACQHYITTSTRIHPFLVDMDLLCNCPACCGQLVKILITHEPYSIFGLSFAYLFTLILSSHPDMQKGSEGLSSIILAGYGL